MVIIYINFVDLESPMLHAKLQEHRTSGFGEEDFFKVFTIYGHGGHLRHVTWTIYINFRFPFPWRLNIKFGFDWPSSFGGEDVLNCGWTPTDGPRVSYQFWLR